MTRQSDYVSDFMRLSVKKIDTIFSSGNTTYNIYLYALFTHLLRKISVNAYCIFPVQKEYSAKNAKNSVSSNSSALRFLSPSDPTFQQVKRKKKAEHNVTNLISYLRVEKAFYKTTKIFLPRSS
ncbi:MAG: hypothetical protein CSA82_00975, partial [Actinobacteria bacterium]